MSMSRRHLLGHAAVATAAVAALPALAGDKDQGKSIAPATTTTTSTTAAASAAPVATGGPFALMALPYADTDLAPVISQGTIGFHYGKHHLGYVNKLNELVAGKDWEKKSLADCMKGTYGTDNVGIYNNSAQTWNHDFYWQSLKKAGGGACPAGKLADAIKAAFGDQAGFATELAKAATGQFGSGWAWLVAKDGKLSVAKTSNADNPVVLNLGTPLLVIDVWEHAYYLDYQNKRSDYVAAVIDKLLNWDFAIKNFG